MISDVTEIRRAGRRWEVRWVEDGQGRSFSREDRRVVESRRAQLLGTITRSLRSRTRPHVGAAASIPNPDLATSSGWAAHLAAIGLALHRAVVDGDGERLVQLRKLQTGTVELAKAWNQSDLHRRTERLLGELIERMEQVGRRDDVEHAVAQHGAAGIASTLQSSNADGPDDPLESRPES